MSNRVHALHMHITGVFSLSGWGEAGRRLDEMNWFTVNSAKIRCSCSESPEHFYFFLDRRLKKSQNQCFIFWSFRLAWCWKLDIFLVICFQIISSCWSVLRISYKSGQHITSSMAEFTCNSNAFKEWKINLHLNLVRRDTCDNCVTIPVNHRVNILLV